MLTDFRSLVRTVAFSLALGLGMTGHTGHSLAETQTTCDQDCFVLTSVSIQGVTAYPLADLSGTYSDLLAREIGVAHLVRTADAITGHYRRDGYFLTRAVVAPGDPASGAAQIVVYEGYIGEVTVEGSGAAAVAAILKPLELQWVLKIDELDRRLALASDVPGIRLTNRIEPILDNPARHRLVVTAELDGVEAGAFVENRGSEAQGPWQVFVSAAANSLALPGDRMTVSVLTIPEDPDELTYGEWSYTVPIGAETRVKGAISGYSTNAPPGSSGWLSGDSVAASLSVTHAIARQRDRSLWATASLDVREVEQSYATGHTMTENLTVARASLWGQMRSAHGSVQASAQISRGLDWFGATTTPGLGLTRADGTGEFTKVNASVSAYRDIGRYVGIYVAGTAQWSDDPLLGSEEFYVGGSEFGRAYGYGELSGESGVSGVVELRAGWDPSPSEITFFQVYGFADAGRVWNRHPGGHTEADLTSAGVGTRITFAGRATIRAELAKPLSGAPINQSDDGWRAFISLSKAF